MRISNFKLERYFAKYEFQAPYILCASDCETFNVQELLNLEETAAKKLKNLKLGYTEYLGHPNLRKEISKIYKHNEIENIIVFSGAEEAIFIFMNSILEREDHIIVQYPAYQSLYEVAHSIGCEITKWVMNSLNNWTLDINLLEENIQKNTKAIIINFPHNPTGTLISEQEFMTLIRIARDYDIYLFSDEVYRFLEHNQSKRLPSAADLYDKAISLGVMSKSFGLAGLRIGWIVTEDKILFNRIAALKDYTTICNSALSEFFAIVALKHKETILQRNMEIVLSNLEILQEFFEGNNHVFHWNAPSASAVAFPRLKKNVSAEKFCQKLLSQQGVLLLPSSKFDFGDSHFRIGYGRKNILEPLKRLEKFVKNY
ncbi:MAG: aminotransferase class I/II-fold pyridoxal phosphate-dependent enzyme [Candidatus Hodarchaeota archaeon]